jgi:hypothetical protein
MQPMESCPVCGFVWDALGREEIGRRIIAAADHLATLLRTDPDAGSRPERSRWSSLEYGAHVRDVLLNLRDRVVLGAIEDNPTPKPMHGDARVERGLYAAETSELVAGDLTVAAALFERTFGAIPPQALARPIFYGWPRPETRTLLWVAAQAVHEAEHHRDDVVENRRLLGRSRQEK